LSFRVDWGGWPRLLNRLLITQPGVGPNTALLQFVFYPAADLHQLVPMQHPLP